MIIDKKLLDNMTIEELETYIENLSQEEKCRMIETPFGKMSAMDVAITVRDAKRSMNFLHKFLAARPDINVYAPNPKRVPGHDELIKILKNNK